jgi:hypothetical protein
MKVPRHATILVVLLGVFGSGCDTAPDPVGLGSDRRGAGTVSYDVQQALAPTNDDFANATAISTLPFSHTVDLTAATVEQDEPTSSCWIWSGFAQKSAWYTFTPTQTGWFAAGRSAAFSNVIAVYAGNSLATLTEVGGGGPGGGCNAFGDAVRFQGQANTTYYVQVHGWFDAGGPLELHFEEVLPPSNDDFAAALSIAALPFSGPVDISAAGLETGEPLPSCGGSVSRTAWFAFTPTETGSISASISNNFSFPPVVAVYTGNELAALTEEGCREFWGTLTLRAEAHTTYYLQVGGLFGQGGPLDVRLEVTPPPIAIFGFAPFDPSVFDVVQFFDNSFDPGQAGFQSFEWTFGDGASGSGAFPTHQYVADGDYSVQLTVTTSDGRTADTAQTVQVRTHDVAITKFSAPKSASAGQTRAITVGINSKRYPETVEVQLFKSVPGGFQFVGVLTQSVPVRPSNRTTVFNFSYTFTGADAQVGKVTFKAVANVVGARDALPADNEAIATPTKVSR